MMNFSTYGMAGVGVAAAIGFVFALSFLGNTPVITDGEGQNLAEEQQQQDSGSAPLSSHQKQQSDSRSSEGESEANEIPMPPQGRAEFAIRDNSVNCETEECLSFYIWGSVREISSDSLTLVQSNQTESNDNSVTVSLIQGPRLLWCGRDLSECDTITYDRIPSGAMACAHARLNPDGSFSIDAIFFNTTCTPQVSLSSNN